MGAPSKLIADLSAEAMHEALQAAIDYAEMADRTDIASPVIALHLKMASRAIRCALEIYGQRLWEKQS
jgi:hypothetical protein